ncbi:hypothetical protein SAMN05421754_102020 [Nitrosomonas sp. Nm58]|nr:hypothetical protein SAMN05421754_102020 [Nitrosomonas sp. Nm58]
MDAQILYSFLFYLPLGITGKALTFSAYRLFIRISTNGSSGNNKRCLTDQFSSYYPHACETLAIKTKPFSDHQVLS